MVPSLFAVGEFVQPGWQKGEGACEENGAAWGNTTVGNEAAPECLRIREFSRCFWIGCIILPVWPSFEFTYVPSDDPSQADFTGARVETCKVHLAKYINFGFGDRELFLNRVLLIMCKLTLGWGVEGISSQWRNLLPTSYTRQRSGRRQYRWAGIYGLVRRRRYTLCWGCRNKRGRRDDTFIYSPIGAATRNTEEVAKSKFVLSQRTYSVQMRPMLISFVWYVPLAMFRVNGAYLMRAFWMLTENLGYLHCC